ncbi:Antitoxin VapB [Alphaproteobacteria bacterium SO-S41]|nr:Antitoxin VapB [Alphaproteobacteria bacterium SO-S41]
MSLNIKDPETDTLARELARLTGKSITEAVKEAIRRDITRADTVRLEMRRRATKAIIDRVHAQPLGDTQWTEDDLYDENGLPA